VELVVMETAEAHEVRRVFAARPDTLDVVRGREAETAAGIAQETWLCVADPLVVGAVDLPFTESAESAERVASLEWRPSTEQRLFHGAASIAV
jgi:hypothetical protein